MKRAVCATAWLLVRRAISSGFSTTQRSTMSSSGSAAGARTATATGSPKVYNASCWDNAARGRCVLDQTSVGSKPSAVSRVRPFWVVSSPIETFGSVATRERFWFNRFGWLVRKHAGGYPIVDGGRDAASYAGVNDTGAHSVVDRHRPIRSTEPPAARPADGVVASATCSLPQQAGRRAPRGRPAVVGRDRGLRPGFSDPPGNHPGSGRPAR